MLKNTQLFISIALLLCSTRISMVASASEQQDAAKDQANAFVQEMLNYFNEHPLSDKSDNPISVQDIFGQVEKSGENAFAKAASSVNVAKPASVSENNDGHADYLSNNVNKAAAPADIPMALRAGVPASVAAAAAMPPNAMAHSAPVVQAAAPLAPAAQVASSLPIVAAAEAPVVPAPVVVANNKPPAGNGISAAAEPVANNKQDPAAPAAASVEPNIVNPQVIGNAAITAVTTFYAPTTGAVEPSVVTVPVGPPTTVSGTSPVVTTATGTHVGTTPTPVTTATVPVTTSRSMNMTTTSTSTMSRSSLTASSTTTIPPISSGSKNNVGLALLVSIVGLVSFFYHHI